MQFDRFTIALLILRPDAPQLDEAAADALQDAHLAHLPELHEQAICSPRARCSVTTHTAGCPS